MGERNVELSGPMIFIIRRTLLPPIFTPTLFSRIFSQQFSLVAAQKYLFVRQSLTKLFLLVKTNQ
jgi:hypothetical protein